MADEELKKKRKIRGGHKGYVTTTLEKVKALLDEFEPPLANQLRTYRIVLTEKLNVLGALDDEILALITEEHIEDEIKGTGNFRESIHQMMVEIDETLNAVELEKAGNTDKLIPLSNSNSLNSMEIPFPSIHSWTRLQVQSMTTLVYQMLTNSII